MIDTEWLRTFAVDLEKLFPGDWPRHIELLNNAADELDALRTQLTEARGMIATVSCRKINSSEKWGIVAMFASLSTAIDYTIMMNRTQRFLEFQYAAIEAAKGEKNATSRQ